MGQGNQGGQGGQGRQDDGNGANQTILVTPAPGVAPAQANQGQNQNQDQQNSTFVRTLVANATMAVLNVTRT